MPKRDYLSSFFNFFFEVKDGESQVLLFLVSLEFPAQFLMVSR